MKTFVLLASPNKKGKTEHLLDAFIEEFGLDCDIVNVYHKRVSPCIDCGYCSKYKGECSIKDDMTEIYKKMENADMIILASPMYFGMFPAPLKAVIDRTQMIWCKKYIFDEGSSSKRKAFVISTSGARWKGMYEAMEKVAKMFFNTIDCSLEDMIIVKNTDKESEEDVKHEIGAIVREKSKKYKEELL